MALRVQFFGTFRVWVDEQDLTSTLAHLGKPKTLFKILLAYPGRRFSQEELIEWLWPEMAPETATSNLRKRVSELRQALEPHLQRGSDSHYILTRSGGYSFNDRTTHTTDAQAFLRAWQRGQEKEHAGQLMEAIGYYEDSAALACGAFLAEDRYEPWALELAREWEERLLTLRERVAQCYIRLGRYDRALDHCLQGLAVRSWSESLHRKKMLCYYYAGDQSEAQKAYQECRQQLRENLDAEPSPETAELYQKIVRQEITPPTKAISHNLPCALTSFIGREREIADIKRLITHVGADGRSPLHRLVTLTGPGGSGKTRLAIEIAAPLLQEYSDGIWLVELASLRDPALVAQAVAGVFGLRPTSGSSLVEKLIDHLGSKNLLLILDNCEHLVHALACLSETLLKASPNLQILATGREAFGIDGEAVWPVAPLAVPPLQPLPPLKSLKQYESVALLVERAMAAQPHFALTPKNASAVASICAHLDGIPLAIELAAARVKVLSIEQIADRLGKRFQLLSEGSPTAPPHQQTLHATVDWSFQLLLQPEQTLFRRLAVFAGGFTLEAVEAICTDPQRPKDSPRHESSVFAKNLLDLMAHLVNKSLVMVQEQRAEARYRLLKTVQEYAGEKLDESGEAERLHRRHQQFFLEWSERASAELTGAQQDLWLERLDKEHDNLRAALAWSLSHPNEAEAGLRLAVALWRFWLLRGYLAEGQQWLERALDASVSLSQPLRAKAFNRAGILAEELGNYAQARSCYEASLALRRELGDPQGLANTLMDLGTVAWKQGEYAVARSLYEESLHIRRGLSDTRGTAASLNSLGLVTRYQGDATQAKRFLEESLALFHDLHNKEGVAATLHNLALVLRDQGQFAEAQRLHSESFSLFRELGNKQGMAFSYIHQGHTARAQGDPQRAAECYGNGLTLCREVGTKEAIAEVFEGMADVFCTHGEFARTVLLLAAAVTLRGAMGSPLAPVDRPGYEQTLLAARAALSPENFERAWTEGARMSLDDAIASILKS